MKYYLANGNSIAIDREIIEANTNATLSIHENNSQVGIIDSELSRQELEELLDPYAILIINEELDEWI